MEHKSVVSSTIQKKSNTPFFGSTHASEQESPFFAPQESSSVDSFFQPAARPIIQTKLTVGQPNDKYEQEADHVADKVVQRLAKSDDNNHPSPITHYPLSTPSVSEAATPIIQHKTNALEEEKLDRKESQDELPELQKSPVSAVGDDEGLQMKCAACEGEEHEHVQRKAQSPPLGGTAWGLESQLSSSKGSGSPLPDNTRSSMESAMGADFSNVRVHTGSNAVQMSQDLNAQAFTHGSDVYFNEGKYNPSGTEGGRLLAHELVHTVQQGGGNVALKHMIQRTTHGGGTTPTNCHNWTIPLPPWIAGTLAHSQIAAVLATAGVFPSGIPRATKVFKGVPNPPPFTPMGFADLWKNTESSVEMAEIKSTSQGDVAARSDLLHYLQRHGEWLTRLPHGPLDMQDTFYFGRVGAPLMSGILDISKFTGTGKNIGPFVGDPLKNLWIEGDSTGSVVYWCTGPGLIGSPLWYPVLKKLLEEAKKLMEQAKKAMEPVLEGAKAFAEWVDKNKGVILTIIAIIVAIILIIIFWEVILAILAALAAGVTAAIAWFGGAEAVISAAVFILALIGVDISPAKVESKKLILMINKQAEGSTSGSGQEGEPTGKGALTSNSSKTENGNPLIESTLGTIAGLSPLVNPLSIYNVASNLGQVPNPYLYKAINSGLSIAEKMGHNSSTAQMRQELSRLNS